MILKEEFKKTLSKDFTINDLEAISNDFAIGFAEWIVDSTLRVDLDGYKTFGDTNETEPHTIKELLEIYKKEKGL